MAFVPRAIAIERVLHRRALLRDDAEDVEPARDQPGGATVVAGRNLGMATFMERFKDRFDVAGVGVTLALP